MLCVARPPKETSRYAEAQNHLSSAPRHNVPAAVLARPMCRRRIALYY